MGLCHGKPSEIPKDYPQDLSTFDKNGGFPDLVIGTPQNQPHNSKNKSTSFPFPSPSPLRSLFKSSPALGGNSNSSSVKSTPLRIFKRPFPPPSPAKHIRSLLAKRYGTVKPNEATIPEGSECDVGLDKNFSFSKQFNAHYELGDEVGKGHFGYTCSAKAKKGALKGQEVAVKVIPKSKVCSRLAFFFFFPPLFQITARALMVPSCGWNICNIFCC